MADWEINPDTAPKFVDLIGKIALPTEESQDRIYQCINDVEKDFTLKYFPQLQDPTKIDFTALLSDLSRLFTAKCATFLFGIGMEKDTHMIDDYEINTSIANTQFYLEASVASIQGDLDLVIKALTQLSIDYHSFYDEGGLIELVDELMKSESLLPFEGVEDSSGIIDHELDQKLLKTMDGILEYLEDINKKSGSEQ
jgi:hypothetical protein